MNTDTQEWENISEWKAVVNTRAVQTLREVQDVWKRREASGLRRLQRRFSDGTRRREFTVIPTGAPLHP